MSRRQLAATAFGALPLLVSRAASAGFAKTVDDIPEERLKQLEKNRGPQLGDDMAFRMVCDRDDEQCLAEKREKGKLKLPGSDGPITQEERSAAIQKQAKACRAFCGRVTLADCDGRDTACLERKREEMKAAGAADGDDILPYVGGAAVIVGVAVTQAPEKTEDPKGMKIRQEFYEKRRRDTETAAAEGVSSRSAFDAAAANKADRESKSEEPAAEPETIGEGQEPDSEA